MPIDWAQPLQTSHDRARHAELLDGAGPAGQRRVAIIGDFTLANRPGMSKGAYGPRFDPKEDWPTVFLFSENGVARCDGAPSDMDIVNVPVTLTQAA